jgi:hypothetical protein
MKFNSLSVIFDHNEWIFACYLPLMLWFVYRLNQYAQEVFHFLFFINSTTNST